MLVSFRFGLVWFGSVLFVLLCFCFCCTGGTVRARRRQQGAWYKFEDDDVTPFDPQEIEACCFGGMALSTSVRERTMQDSVRVVLLLLVVVVFDFMLVHRLSYYR